MTSFKTISVTAVIPKILNKVNVYGSHANMRKNVMKSNE